MSTNAIDLQPLPSLPIELKGEILTHCDADTLAKASSASLAFLQLASPLLYEHITFVGPEGLMKFLTLRADVQVPALNPYLDLSLVQSITYIDLEGRSFVPGIVCPDEDDLVVVHPDYKAHVFAPLRLIPLGATGPTFTPLALNSLHAKLVHDTQSMIWSFFNPVVVRIKGSLRRRGARDEMEALGFRDLHLCRATRLRELTLVDAVMNHSPLYLPDYSDGPWVLRYELSVETDRASSIEWIVSDLSHDDEVKPSRVEKIVIQVETEAIKTKLLRQLVISPFLDRTTISIKPALASTSAATSAGLA